MSEKSSTEKKSKTFDGAAIAVAVSFEATYRIPATVSAPEDVLNELAESMASSMRGLISASSYTQHSQEWAFQHSSCPFTD